MLINQDCRTKDALSYILNELEELKHFRRTSLSEGEKWLEKLFKGNWMLNISGYTSKCNDGSICGFKWHFVNDNTWKSEFLDIFEHLGNISTVLHSRDFGIWMTILGFPSVFHFQFMYNHSSQNPNKSCSIQKKVWHVDTNK